jgi:phage-related protein
MPIGDEVSLDIGAALDAVESLGSALTDAVSSFRTELDEALAGLATVTIEGDASSVSESIVEAVESADTIVPIEADVEAFGGSIDEALAGIASTIPVEADTSQLSAEIEAVTGEPQVVPVVADTSGLSTTTTDAQQASQSLDDVGNSAIAAAGGLATFSGSGGLGAASGALSKVPGVALPAGAAIGVVTAAGDKFFNSAVNANAATERFNQTFGELSSEVNNVNVGTLDQSLADLNLSLGSSTSQVRNVLSTFGQLGQSSGRSAEDIALASEQLTALSARAVALNPNLGSVGDVADRLSTALARGGRFAGNFGITLTSAEIETRALADTGKRTAAELTQFDKAAAGAAIAAERYGDSLQTDIAKGAESPIIQLRSMQAEFAKFTTALGQPLIAPVLGILDSLLPIAESAANVLGALAAAFAPILDAALSALQPLIGGVLNTFADIVSSLTPLFENVSVQITSILGPALEGLGPLFESIVGLFGALVGAVQPLLRLIQPLAELFGNVLGFFAEGAALALGAVVDVISLLVTKTGEVVSDLIQPLIDLGAQLGLIDEASSSAAEAQREYAKNVEATIGSVDELAGSLADARAGFEEYVLTQSKFAGDPALLNQLRRTGISFDELATQSGNLDAGLKALTAQAIKAGQVQINVGGVEQSAEDIKNLDGSLTALLNTEGTQVVTGDSLLRGFIDLTTQTEAQAQANYDLIAAQQGLTDEQLAAIGVQAQQQFGVDSYTNRLQVLAQQQAVTTEQQAASNATLGSNAAAWTALTQAVASGAVTEQQAAQAALALGVDVQTATGFIQASQQAIDAFVANAVSKIPTVSTVFDDLNEATSPTDPQSLANNLNAATLSALTFQANIDTIRQKFPEVAALLQEKGPEAAGAFAQTFLASGEVVQTELEKAIVANKGAISAIETDLRSSISGSSAAASQLGNEVSTQLGLGMDFSGVTEEQVAEMTGKLGEAGVIDPAKATAGSTGESIGAALAFGMGTGLFDNLPGLEEQAREAVRRMEAAIKDEAGIRSPSTLFAGLGDELSAGLALGLDRSAQDVVSAAESVVAGAARAVAAEQLQADLTAGSPTAAAAAAGGTLVQFGNLSFSVSVGAGATPQEADAAARALASAFVDEATVKLEARIS